jgi:hypothetical protein
MSQSTLAPAPRRARVILPSGVSHPRLRIVEHAGHQVIIFDLRGLQDGDESVALIEGPYRRFMDAQTPDKSCLTLVDARGTPNSARGTAAMREFARLNIPYVNASAVLTSAAIHRLVVGTVAMATKRKIKAFEEERAALEWLVAQ